MTIKEQFNQITQEDKDLLSETSTFPNSMSHAIFGCFSSIRVTGVSSGVARMVQERNGQKFEQKRIPIIIPKDPK